MNRYLPNTAVDMIATFKVNNVLTDPTTITFRIKDPLGVRTVYVYLTNTQLIRDSVGTFRVRHVPVLYGFWFYTFEGTGVAHAPGEKVFYVTPSQFP